MTIDVHLYKYSSDYLDFSFKNKVCINHNIDEVRISNTYDSYESKVQFKDNCLNNNNNNNNNIKS
jgi:hypothetical protein